MLRTQCTVTSIRGGVKKDLLRKLTHHTLFNSSHTTFYQLAPESTWVQLREYMCVRECVRANESPQRHLNASSGHLCLNSKNMGKQDLPDVYPAGTWSPERCRLWVWRPIRSLDPPHLRVPNLRWQSPRSRCGSGTPAVPLSKSGSRVCQCTQQGVLIKQIPLLTLGLDSPLSEFPGVTFRSLYWRRFVVGHLKSSREFRRMTSNCLRSCPSANVPNKLQNKHVPPSECSFQPCSSFNSSLKLKDLPCVALQRGGRKRNERCF